jgi:hypothetical protein
MRIYLLCSWNCVSPSIRLVVKKRYLVEQVVYVLGTPDTIECSAQADWTLTHTSHKNTGESTIETSTTLDGVTLTDILIRWSPNEWPSVCREIPVFWTSNTYLLIYGAEPFLRSCQLCSPSGTSQHFMEPEGSMNILYFENLLHSCWITLSLLCHVDYRLFVISVV